MACNFISPLEVESLAAKSSFCSRSPILTRFPAGAISNVGYLDSTIRKGDRDSHLRNSSASRSRLPPSSAKVSKEKYVAPKHTVRIQPHYPLLQKHSINPSCRKCFVFCLLFIFVLEHFVYSSSQLKNLT